MDRNWAMINIETTLSKTTKSDKGLQESIESSTYRYEKKVNDFIRVLNRAPSFLETRKEINTSELYKIIIPPEFIAKITDGTAKLNTDGLGRLLPTVTDSKGKILCQVRLEEMKPEKYQDMSNVAVQSSLSDILNMLEVINENVQDILLGQHTDRLGIIKGAEHTYSQAILAESKETKEALLHASASSFNEGRAQLILSLESKFKLTEKLPDTKFKLFLESVTQRNSAAKNEKLFQEIHDIIGAIINATYYLSLIYEELGQYKSLKKSFEPLQENIHRYASICNKLSEYVPYRKGISNDRPWYKNPDRTLEMLKEKIGEIEHRNSKGIVLHIKGGELITEGDVVNE